MIVVYYNLGGYLSFCVAPDGIKVKQLIVKIYGSDMTLFEASKIQLILGNTEYRNGDAHIPATTAENRLLINDHRGKDAPDKDKVRIITFCSMMQINLIFPRPFFV